MQASGTLPVSKRQANGRLVLRPDELPGVLQLGTRRVAELVASGAIPCVEFGPRLRRYPVSLVERWLEQQATRGAE